MLNSMYIYIYAAVSKYGLRWRDGCHEKVGMGYI